MTITPGSSSLPTAYLAHPDGRLAYDESPPTGAGRGLDLALPGMGDLRSSYRFLAPALIRRTWGAYLPSLYAGRRPEDFDAYRAQVGAVLRSRSHAVAFSRTSRTRHAPAEAALGGVHARALVVMGRQDPDFPDPQAEADWIADRLDGEVLMVDEAGHYPHAQRPDVVVPAVLGFLAGGRDA